MKIYSIDRFKMERGETNSVLVARARSLGMTARKLPDAFRVVPGGTYTKGEAVMNDSGRAVIGRTYTSDRWIAPQVIILH